MRLINLCLPFVLLGGLCQDCLTAPLLYSVSFTGQDFSNGSADNPLKDARIEAVLSFDPDVLTPLFDHAGNRGGWITSWPLTNTKGWVKISGTQSDDGSYPANVTPAVAPADTTNGLGFGWGFARGDAGGVIGTSISRPRLDIPFREDTLRIFPLLFIFKAQANLNAPLQPAPISPDQLSGWRPPEAALMQSGLRFEELNTTGYAVEIPEPSAIALAGVGVLVFVALRRRA